ncbi:MAG: CDP-diacylglycerol--glycerol-3-phosphate 3-phosphatidyltransferase [Desulfobulbaceae bacterium]|nr:CDP-diacylglycerol--glycerol-3-phosphate 3-phosphatidyltransferase [Desulfobulbaceae bacterium]
MNVANAITLVRILLIPVLVIFLIENEPRFAFLVFVAAGVSDGLDGFVARVFKQKTMVGAYLDPIADKLLLNTAFVTMAVLGILPAWLAVVVVSRDVIIVAGIGVLMLFDRPVEIRPSLISKTTTCVQIVLVGVFLGHQYMPILVEFERPLIYLTAIFTLLSGFHYIVVGFRGLVAHVEPHHHG